VKRNSRSRKK